MGRKDEEKMRGFDEILEHIGGWSRYQAILLLLCIPFATLMAYATYTPVLFLHTPNHACAQPRGTLDDQQCGVTSFGQVSYKLMIQECSCPARAQSDKKFSNRPTTETRKTGKALLASVFHSFKVSIQHFVMRAEIEDFDQILSHIGGWSRYQASLLLLSLPFAMMMAFTAYTPVLFLYAPSHTCMHHQDMQGENVQCNMIDEGKVIKLLMF